VKLFALLILMGKWQTDGKESLLMKDPLIKDQLLLIKGKIISNYCLNT